VQGKCKVKVQPRSKCSRNQGGFRSTVKIRDFELTIDRPKGFGGGNTGPKPTEVLLAALAACQEITWRLYADALGIPLAGIEVELDELQDLRGFSMRPENACRFPADRRNRARG
jgi:uncharacterized OsmC-like protein